MMTGFIEDDYRWNFQRMVSSVCSHAKLLRFVSSASTSALTQAAENMLEIVLLSHFPSSAYRRWRGATLSFERKLNFVRNGIWCARGSLTSSSLYRVCFKAKLPVASVKINKTVRWNIFSSENLFVYRFGWVREKQRTHLFMTCWLSSAIKRKLAWIIRRITFPFRLKSFF